MNNTTPDPYERFYRDRFASKTTGIKIEQADVDYARCSLEINDGHLNVNDCVMGGAIFTLADFAFGVAANFAGIKTVSLSSSINYLSPTVGPVLYAEVRCNKSGRSVAFYDIAVTDSTGKLVATVAATGFLMSK